MSEPGQYETPDGVIRGLGCLLPDAFPTGFRTFVDLPGITVQKLDTVRSTIAGKRSLYNRRQLFGPKWIKNQHSTNGCNGYSIAAAMSKTIFLRSGQSVILSGSDAYSQMNGGRDRGSALADGMRVLESGVAREELVPWQSIYSNQISAAAKADRVNHRGFELFAVDTEEGFASGILYGFIGVVAVHVANGFDSRDADGVCRGGNGPGNHSVHVDDIGVLPSGELIYDMPNSWDVTWGDEGRTLLTWQRHLRESVKYHRFFLIGSALDVARLTNPPAATN